MMFQRWMMAAMLAAFGAAGCSLDHTDILPGPCGMEGQRCCRPDEVAAMRSPANGCAAGHVCGAGGGLDGGVSSPSACRRCPAGDPDVCSNACVNLRTDTRNCGRCASVCAGGERCVAIDGAAEDAGAGDGGATGAVCRPMCPAGQEFCPGRGCSNRMTDPSNCGACGNVCVAGQSCTGGRCICPGAGNLSYCSAVTRCVDLQTDAAHCGMCGTACPAGQSCMAGRCTCANAALAFCPALGRCVDLQTDSANCGACGNTCPSGQPCTRGACFCTPRTTFCPTAMRCVDLQTDSANCGACGNACPTGQSCTGGRCICPGAGNLSFCSALGRCVDLQTDPTNCGACGTSCPSAGSCRLGACACATTGQTFCAAIGGCTDLQTDPTHCGACGAACRPGEGCVAGRCVCPGSGTAFCAALNRCTDLANDSTNCGACGRACLPGQSCSAGGCICLISGQSFCAGTGCINLMTDINHCGMCGRRCPEGQVCGGGACRCPTGLTLCGSTCVDLARSDTHCGACGTNCETTFTNGLGVCRTSRCELATCRTGFGDCDRAAASGCEISLATDATHCGTCGNRCRFANAAATCSGGVCAMGSCNVGFVDCNTDPVDGCETDTRSDTSNCGACANRCTAPVGRTPICVSSACSAGGICTAPLADCNAQMADGCEANTNTDRQNCGACGHACNATNGTPTCAGGVCAAITCSAGFGNCDGNLGNGCEAALASDNAHCGVCGRVCTGGTRCTAGSCV